MRAQPIGNQLRQPKQAQGPHTPPVSQLGAPKPHRAAHTPRPPCAALPPPPSSIIKERKTKHARAESPSGVLKAHRRSPEAGSRRWCDTPALGHAVAFFMAHPRPENKGVSCVCGAISQIYTVSCLAEGRQKRINNQEL